VWHILCTYTHTHTQIARIKINDLIAFSFFFFLLHRRWTRFDELQTSYNPTKSNRITIDIISRSQHVLWHMRFIVPVRLIYYARWKRIGKRRVRKKSPTNFPGNECCGMKKQIDRFINIPSKNRKILFTHYFSPPNSISFRTGAEASNTSTCEHKTVLFFFFHFEYKKQS